MAEDNNTNGITLNLTEVANKFYDDTLHKPNVSIGNVTSTLIDFCDALIGIPMKQFIYKRNFNFENFKQQIVLDASKIPQNYLKNPEFDVVGLALEKYKYQFEDTEIVQILKNIILKTMDKRYSNKLKTYYIDIVCQLSSTDIILLKDLKKNQNEFILKFYIFINNLNSNLQNSTPKTFIELEDLNLNLLEDFNESLDNLNRLNLLVPYEPTLYLNTTNEPKSAKLFEEIIKVANIDCPDGYKLDFDLGALKLTDLAKNIINLCIL